MSDVEQLLQRKANFPVTENFAAFFKSINPSPTFEAVAAREHGAITSLILNSDVAKALQPYCFLQGSYKQDTAIHTINDVDIVVLCDELAVPGTGGGAPWNRHAIFDTIAHPLLNSGRYRDKVLYHQQSMCIKVELEIKVEILPVVKSSHAHDEFHEPFRLCRQPSGEWVDGFARKHQEYLSQKNSAENTGGNFIPMIKVMKHLRSINDLDAVSFHIECLLEFIPDEYFHGSMADCIGNVLGYIAGHTSEEWYNTEIMTPCYDRNIMHESEWSYVNWILFHQEVKNWHLMAEAARGAQRPLTATMAWRSLLGDDYFPL